jgi:hypothetical protein
MEKEKLFSIIKLICFDYKTNKNIFIAPCLNLDRQDPLFNEEQFNEFLEEIYPQIQEQTRNLPDISLISEVLKELLYDGKGYMVPCFSCYVNQKPEKQVYNDIRSTLVQGTIPPQYASVPFYNFQKDLVFLYFLKDLADNLDNLENWISKKRTSHTLEFIDEYTQYFKDGVIEKLNFKRNER